MHYRPDQQWKCATIMMIVDFGVLKVRRLLISDNFIIDLEEFVLAHQVSSPWLHSSLLINYNNVFSLRDFGW